MTEKSCISETYSSFDLVALVNLNLAIKPAVARKAN